MGMNIDFSSVLKTLKKSMSSKEPVNEVVSKLKWLMLARVLTAVLLLGSTFFFQLRTQDILGNQIISFRYLLIAFLFLLCLFYGIVSNKIKHQVLFAYIQIAIDSFLVTVLILITGGFFSFFSFLYLVVIIYASMILYLRGGVVIAFWSTLQYTVITILQCTSVLPTIGVSEQVSLFHEDGFQILYKLLITAIASFAVAVLSGLLTEQNRETKKELKSMSAHLKRVEKMAYMGEMAAGLAHEIKNPLASIVGSIQMLKDDFSYDSDQQRLMDIILRETDRLSILVTNFLFFARPPAGKPIKFNLSTAIEEIICLFEKDSLHSARLKFERELQSDLWVIMDPTHLRQILWNLLLNAAEAIQNEGRIGVRTFLQKNGNIRIQVSDTGCGIPSEVLHSIFDPFFTTKPEGTGLGLSIVHRILEAYDSRLDVHSEIGKGTVFSYALRQVNPVDQLTG